MVLVNNSLTSQVQAPKQTLPKGRTQSERQAQRMKSRLTEVQQAKENISQPILLLHRWLSTWRSPGHRHLFNKVSKSMNSVPRHYKNTEQYVLLSIKARLMLNVAMHWNWGVFYRTERGYSLVPAPLPFHLHSVAPWISMLAFFFLLCL